MVILIRIFLLIGAIITTCGMEENEDDNKDEITKYQLEDIIKENEGKVVVGTFSFMGKIDNEEDKDFWKIMCLDLYFNKEENSVFNDINSENQSLKIRNNASNQGIGYKELIKRKIQNIYVKFGEGESEKIKKRTIYPSDEYCSWYVDDLKETKWIVYYIFTQEFENLKHGFSLCKSLISLDFSNFSFKNIKTLEGLCEGCSNLKNVSFGNKNLKNLSITNMSYMFYGCSNLNTITNLDKIDVSNVTNTSFMFADCFNLINLDLRMFDTKNVTNMRAMFHRCSNLTELDLSHFDTEKVTDMSYMFYGCSNLKRIRFGEKFSSGLKNIKCMFYDCRSLKYFIFPSSYIFVDSEKEGEAGVFGCVFKNCKNLKDVKFGVFHRIFCCETYKEEISFKEFLKVIERNVKIEKNNEILNPLGINENIISTTTTNNNTNTNF